MYDVSVWSLKLEIGFLPLFLRSFVALCCFLGGYLDPTVWFFVTWCCGVLRRGLSPLVLLLYVGGLLPGVDSAR